MGDTTKKTLDDLKVQEYIKYRATMDCMFLRVELYGKEWESIKSEEKFLAYIGLSEKSRQSLVGYRQIEGFKEAVNTEKNKFGKKMVQIANTGLYKRAQGMTIIKQKVTVQGDVVDCKEELAPEPKACELIHKIFGSLTDKVEVEHTVKIQNDWKKAAETLDTKEGDKQDDSIDGRH